MFVWAVLEADSVVSSGWCLAGGGDDGWLSGATGRAGMVRRLECKGQGGISCGM